MSILYIYIYIHIFGIETYSITWRCFFSEFAPVFSTKIHPLDAACQAAEEAKAVHFGGDEDAIFMLGAKTEPERGFFGVGVWGYTQTKMKMMVLEYDFL